MNLNTNITTQVLNMREIRALLENDASLLINRGETDPRGFDVTPFKRARLQRSVRGMIFTALHFAPIVATLVFAGAM